MDNAGTRLFAMYPRTGVSLRTMRVCTRRKLIRRRCTFPTVLIAYMMREADGI